MKTVIRNINLVISDVGGVLVNTENAIFDLIEDIARRRGIRNGSRDDILSVIGTKIERYFYEYLPDDCKDQTSDCYAEFCNMYPDSVKDKLVPFPGTAETLAFLKAHGIKIAVISCMREQAIKTCISQLGCDRFDSVVSYLDRPNPDGIRKLLKSFGVLPNNTLYVGDTPVDIQMGKNAQVQTVAVMTGAVGIHKPDLLRKQSPDYILDAFRDLPGIIWKEEILRQ